MERGDSRVHSESAGFGVGERERERERKERDLTLLCSPGIILAWAWNGPGAFSRQPISQTFVSLGWAHSP